MHLLHLAHAVSVQWGCMAARSLQMLAACLQLPSAPCPKGRLLQRCVTHLLCHMCVAQLSLDLLSQEVQPVRSPDWLPPPC